MTEASASICLILATALKSGLPPDSFHCHAIKNKSEAVQWKRPKTLNVVEDQDINNLTKSAYFSLARQTAENHNEKLFFFSIKTDFIVWCHLQPCIDTKPADLTVLILEYVKTV